MGFLIDSAVNYAVQDLCNRVINHVFEENATLKFKLKSFGEKKSEVKRLKEEFNFNLRQCASELFYSEGIYNLDTDLYCRGGTGNLLYRLGITIQEDIVPKILKHILGNEYFYVKIRFNLIDISRDYTVEKDSGYSNIPKIYYSRRKHKWQVCGHEFEVNQDSIYCPKCNHIFKSYGSKSNAKTN